MPGGRPSKYKAAYCEQVIDLGREGKSEAQIAACLDIPRTTLRSWGEQHPQFSSALRRAKDLEQAWWEDKAQDNLENREFNSALWHKNVASRFRAEYGDKVQHTGADGEGPVVIVTGVQRAEDG